MLIEGRDYFVAVWCFPNYASDMFVVQNPDATFTLNLNSRFTKEQLLKNVPHEFRHMVLNHFQSEMCIEDIEREAG